METFIPAKVVIPNFTELQALAYLMSSSVNFGALDGTLSEVNKIHNALAYRFQGIGPGSLPVPPQPIVHQVYTRLIPLYKQISCVVNLIKHKRCVNRQ